MSEARDRAITSLAILKVNYDKRGLDYIDYFVPFAAEAMRTSSGESLEIGDIEQSIRSRFGLTLPRPALQTILRRASKNQFVKLDHGRYFPLHENLDGIDFQEAHDRALEDQTLLIDRFVEYAKPIAGPTFGPENASSAILGYVQQRGVAFLRHALDARVQVPLQSATPGDLGFVANGFVIHLSKNDPDGFQALQTVVKGAVLAGAAYSSDIGRIRNRFQRLDVYLDTRILLRLLGMAGEEHERIARELVDLGYGLGASFYCFDNTLSELRGVLSAASYALRYRRAFRTNSGETLEYLASAGFQASDVELVIADLEPRLRDVRVSVRTRPAHNIPWTVDEADLASRLAAEVSYRSEDPLRHDLDSITAIQRLRRNEKADVLESSRAVFVTTNSKMARIANQFMHEAGLTGIVPVVHTEQEFGTICWLKSPTSAPDLPVSLIIADTMAAMNPPEYLWRAYLAEIDQLETRGDITNDDYVLLRFSTAAKGALLDLTRGRPGALAAGVVPEVLSRTRDAIVREAEPELLSRGRDLALAEAADKIRQQVAMREDSDRKSISATQELEAQQRRITRRTGRWAHRAGRVAFFLTFVLGTAVVITTATVGSNLFSGDTSSADSTLVRVLAVSGVIGLLLGVVNVVTGGSVIGLSRNAELATSRIVHAWLMTQLTDRHDGDDPTDP